VSVIVYVAVGINVFVGKGVFVLVAVGGMGVNVAVGRVAVGVMGVGRMTGIFCCLCNKELTPPNPSSKARLDKAIVVPKEYPKKVSGRKPSIARVIVPSKMAKERWTA
jgi:hypothetical protein